MTVSANITGLTPGTTYHFCIVAQNRQGTTNGTDNTFTTQMPLVKVGQGSLLIDGKPFRFVGANSIYFGFYSQYGWSIDDAISSPAKTALK